ncbi:tRNA adenosine(34) deaminase TadA [Fluviispira vulneris]|uniref:tRNA adenosine(34) deaminase TadA n=1 Tax=Fluviispira vulneris TaxID=2763012 RepID=UPI001C97B500|nr:tRNA adenosine(34) deaminase TadA [Fluviispira vulneris]
MSTTKSTTQSLNHQVYMEKCIELAKKASELGEVPVGAMIVNAHGEIISEAYNLRETENQATAHAELIAIELACKKLGRWRLSDCSLYVSLEPCFMCAGAIILARIPNIIFAACDPKAGAVGSLDNILNDKRLNHQCEITQGICSEESSMLLKSFFKARRKK